MKVVKTVIFEEMVCQIARREKIEGATRFINKDGSGGV